MSDPSVAIQKAIYEVLSGGSPAALNCPVYDGVPQNTGYPYVSIDTTVALPDDPLASRRDEQLMYLSVWSQYRGRKEVMEIIAQIDAALHQQRLPMQNGRMVRCYVIRRNVVREPDNMTFQGAVTLRVIAEH